MVGYLPFCPTGECGGCANALALNYDAQALYDDGSCEFDGDAPGCTDVLACNFDPYANVDDGSCGWTSTTMAFVMTWMRASANSTLAEYAMDPVTFMTVVAMTSTISFAIARANNGMHWACAEEIVPPTSTSTGFAMMWTNACAGRWTP